MKNFSVRTISLRIVLASANVSWRTSSPMLLSQGHINKALSNNLDVRVAMQNVASAQAYLKQSKAAFIPTLAAQANYTRATSSINAMGGRRRTYLRQPMGSHRLSLVGSRYLGQALCSKTCFLCFLPRYGRGTKSRTIRGSGYLGNGLLPTFDA